MMPAADLIAGIEAHCSQAIERALPADVLGGRLLILRATAGEPSWGLASGSGRVAAVANGGAATDRAITLNVPAIIDYYKALDEARAAAVAIGCHELAHLLTAKPDPLVTHDEATAIWNEVLTMPSIGGVCWHCPRWAGAFFVAADRLKTVLPAVEHRAVIRLVWAGLRQHGFAPLEILDALTGLTLPASIGEAFAPGAAAALALAAVCDDELTRQAWIDRSFRKTSATSANAA